MSNSNEIITQQEIDALLNILDNDEIASPLSDSRFDTYNFNKELLSDKQKLLLLEELHKEFLDNLTNFIKNSRKKDIFLKLLSIKETFIKANSDNDYLEYGLRVENIGSEVKFFISKNAINSIVDIYLGGDGAIFRTEKLSELEERIFEYFLNEFRDSLNQSWQFCQDIDKQEISSFKSLDKVIKIKIEIEIAKYKYNITLIYPSKKIDFLILKSQNYQEKEDKDFKKIENIEVELNFVVAEKLISIKEAKSLFINQILEFDKFSENKNIAYINEKEFFNFSLQNSNATITKNLGLKNERDN